MTDLDYHETAIEAAFSLALRGVAEGASTSEVDGTITRLWPRLSAEERRTLLADALDDARSCGIEDEDIDGSWLT